MTSALPDPSLPAKLREFHERLPLAGDPPNALLSLPDDRLLYLIALLRDTPVPAPTLSLEEWREFREVLVPHSIFPLLAYRLRKWPKECRPPEEVTAYLDIVLAYAVSQTVHADRQIQVAVDALEAAGIESVLLKGPALARTVYPDPALRQSVDIDLLVRPADVLAAESVLEGLGYVSSKKEFHISPYRYHHQSFIAPGDGLRLELHWSLDTDLAIFPGGWVEETISRRVSVKRDDLSFHTLSHSDHLLYLAFHTAFTHWAVVRLDWIIDSALVMANIRDPAECQRLIARSVEHHVRIPLELTVTQAGLWAAPEALQVVPEISSWPAANDRERRLWKYATTRHASVISGFYLDFQGQPGIIEKFRYCYRYAVPPTPMMGMFRRSSSRMDIPLAHLRRWARIFKYI